MNSHRAYFGDAEYDFRLTGPMILELERKCGSGITVICNRLFTRTFSDAELHETLRCALIGGGTDPKRAAELIATYSVGRPYSETYPIADAVAELLWFGNPNESTNGQA